MYRAEKWIDGWLWIQTVPDGKWQRATTEEVIAALIERIRNVEQLLGHEHE